MTFKTQITDILMCPVRIYRYGRDLKQIAKRTDILGKEMENLIKIQGELTDIQRLHYTRLLANLNEELLGLELEYRSNPNA